MGDDEEQSVIHKHYSIPRLNPPDKFDFNDPGQWSRWKARWGRYREASRLCEQEDKEQINTLVYTLGPQAEDVILARNITEDTHDNLIKAFDDYFGVRTNTIAERAKFNRLVQGEDGMDVFINKLYRQAEYCDYKALREELIRDRLVVGVMDDTLSSQLQAVTDLTLAAAVTMCRQFESAKQAQSVVRPSSSSSAKSSEVDSVESNGKIRRNQKFNRAKTTQSYTATGTRDRDNIPQRCHRCGRGPHQKSNCPALNSVCNHCRKHGHWKVMCRLLSKVHEVHEADESDSDTQFLGEVKQHSRPTNNQSWSVRLYITFNNNDEIVKEFKLDTGAEVSICGVDSYSGDYHKLFKPDKKLVGPGNTVLPVLGFVNAKLRVSDKSIVEKVYVVDNQVANLLSKNACIGLGLISCDANHVYNVCTVPDNVSNNDWVSEYSDIFKGLGRLSDPYTMSNQLLYMYHTKCQCPVCRW